MGGALSFVLSVLAAFAFARAGSYALAVLAGFVSLICLWSWIHMWYFARVLARQRLFVAALHRGDFAEGSPEAERYWQEMPIHVEQRDVHDVPDWITVVNMAATAVAVILLAWGLLTWIW
jgi:hypothetical protein